QLSKEFLDSTLGLVPIIMMVTVVTVVTVPAVPIVRPVIAIVRPVIAVRIIVSVGVISVVARSEPNREVDLSIRTWHRSKAQAPRHQSNQQKFLHCFTSSN